MKSRNMLGRWIRAKAPLLVAGVALIGSGAVVGIGGSGAASAAAKNKKVTITFWNAYNDVTETPVMNGIVIPAFERLHPNIKVIDETLPYDGMLNKFIAASAGGNPPNLMRSDIAWVPQLASEGILLETSKQPWFAAVKKDAFPGPMSTNYWKGGYWGIPDDTNTQVLFWNKADFAAANLSGPPTTWAQMMPRSLLSRQGQWFSAEPSCRMRTDVLSGRLLQRIVPVTRGGSYATSSTNPRLHRVWASLKTRCPAQLMST